MAISFFVPFNSIRTANYFAVRIILIVAYLNLPSCNEIKQDYKGENNPRNTSTTLNIPNRNPCESDSEFAMIEANPSIRNRIREIRLLSELQYLRYSCQHRLDLSVTDQSKQIIPLNIGNSWKYTRLFDNDTSHVLDGLLFNIFPESLTDTLTLPFMAVRLLYNKRDSVKLIGHRNAFWRTDYIGIRKWHLTNRYLSDSTGMYVFSNDPHGTIVGLLPVIKGKIGINLRADTVRYVDIFSNDIQQYDSCGNLTGWQPPMLLKTILGTFRCYPYTGSDVDTLYFVRGIGIIRAALRNPLSTQPKSYAIELKEFQLQ